MTEKEQIEEMKDIIDGSWNTKGAATKLYNAGYRKIPKDSVVLTKEEYEKLGLVVETIQEYESLNGQPILVNERKVVKKLKTDFTELLNQEIRELQLVNAIKETAEKILEFGKKFFKNYDGHYNEGFCLFMAWIETQIENGYFAKQFGLEIKE